MPKNTPPGPAVDSSGQTVLDPSPNVLDVVRAETRRQDDLREMTAEHLQRELELRAEYEEKLRLAESRRLDAVRETDVGNVSTAAQAQTAAATALAATVDRKDEAARAERRAESDAIRKDINQLQQAQYLTAGGTATQRDQVVDRRAGSANVGMWVGVAIAGAAILFSGFLTTVGIAVSLYIATR